MDDNNPTVVAANPKAVLDAAKEAITSPIKKRVGAKADQSTDILSEPKTAKGIVHYIPIRYHEWHEIVLNVGGSVSSKPTSLLS